MKRNYFLKNQQKKVILEHLAKLKKGKGKRVTFKNT